MPWRISDDLKRFKALTTGKPVIMGRKTFESIGAALSGRDNIVISRRTGWRPAGARLAAGLNEAFALSASAAEAMVIGGGEIYAAALPRARRIHLTRVDAEFQGEAFFPRLDPSDWRKTAAGFIPKSPRNDFPCRLFVLDRLD